MWRKTYRDLGCLVPQVYGGREGSGPRGEIVSRSRSHHTQPDQRGRVREKVHQSRVSLLCHLSQLATVLGSVLGPVREERDWARFLRTLLFDTRMRR